MRFLDQYGLLFLGVLLGGCGPSFDPPDQLSTLRVLGVQKDLPYAQAGQTVNLQMLWEDASPSAGRPIQITWSEACANPDGDLYYSCFTPDKLPTLLPNPALGQTDFPHGDTTQVTAAPIAHPATESNAPYGITFVFFAACAGTLQLITPSDPTALPFACKDAAGNLLDSDSFVAGYTSIYSFQTFTNNNPAISGFQFNGHTLTNDSFCGPPLPGVDPSMQPANCTPIAEASSAADIDCTDPVQGLRCVPTCADDGKSTCPAYAIQPTVDKNDPLNQDQDQGSAMQLGHPVGEEMWIDYYTDGGGFKSPVRLLNDPTSGWNDNYGTDFYASKDAKVSRVWALVHDNRGGVAWAGTTIKTQ
jgi:hypothetical protein